VTNEIYKSNEVQLRQQIQARLNALDAAVTAAVSDTAYDATTWNGVTTIAPSKNAVRDEIEAIKADYVPDTGNTTIAGVKTFSSDPLIPDEAYGSGWNGVLEPPTKNAVYDAIVELDTRFSPALMQFNGSTGFYNGTYTSSGNKITLTARFKVPSFTGGASQLVCKALGPTNRIRGQIAVISSDHATTGRRSRVLFQAQNSAGTNICVVVSTNTFTDDLLHTVFADYDGDSGTTVLRIDGNNEVDTGNAEYVLTTGTMDSGASSVFLVGSNTAAGALFLLGQAGYIGMRDVDGLTWSDFMTATGRPKDLNETAWTEWGGQPLYWNPHGQMTDHTGSAAVMTKNGTIRVWWEGLGNTIGLNI